MVFEDISLGKIVIFDIDGTLVNVDHREHYVREKPKNWMAFEKAIPHDSLYEDMRFLCYILWKTYPVYLVTGRSERTRSVTEKQLLDFNIPYDQLIMKSNNDPLKDNEFKVKVAQEFISNGNEIFLWFEDRERVVRSLRDIGVRVLQVKDGSY